MKMGTSGIARLSAAVALGLACSGAAAETAPAGPRAVIEQTVEEVLAVLRTPGLSSQERRSGIEQIAYQRFDFATMSRLVLARNWRRFSPEQRTEFQAEFKRYLALNYGSRIDRYDQEEVEITDERPEPRGDVTIKTRIVGGQYENAVVDYRLRQNDGHWYVIDVVIEGISLISNYRDQFKEVVNRGGPERLIAKLREKNDKGVPDPE